MINHHANEDMFAFQILICVYQFCIMISLWHMGIFISMYIQYNLIINSIINKFTYGRKEETEDGELMPYIDYLPYLLKCWQFWLLINNSPVVIPLRLMRIITLLVVICIYEFLVPSDKATILCAGCIIIKLHSNSLIDMNQNSSL